MKHNLELSDLQLAPQNVLDAVFEFQRRKHGIIVKNLSYSEIIELRMAFGNGLHHETSDEESKIYNNILYGSESVVGWEGKEGIDIEWYQLIQEVKNRITVKSREMVS